MPIRSAYGNGPKKLKQPTAGSGDKVFPSQSDIPEQTLDDAFARFQAANSAAQAAKAAQPAPQANDQGAQAPTPSPSPEAVSPAALDDVEEQFQSQPEMTPADAAQVAQSGITEDPGSQPLGSRVWDTWARIKAGLGRNPQEVKAILQKTYGDENVILKGDKAYFRRSYAEKFRPLDLDKFEAMGDLIADISGPAIETVAGVAAGGAAMIAGGGTPAAAFPAAAVGGTAGAYARREAVAMTGVDPNQYTDNVKEAELASASNAAFLALGYAPGLLFRAIKSGVQEWPVNRLTAHQQMKDVMAKVIDEIGTLPKVTAPEGRLVSGVETSTKRDVGQQIGNAVDAIGKQLEDQVGLVDSRAIAISGNKYVPTERGIKAMRDILKGEGAILHPDGHFEMPKFGQNTDDLRGFKPFGDAERGPGALSKLITDYNMITRDQSRTGLPFAELLDWTRGYQKLSKYDEMNPLSPEIRTGYKQISSALANDRNDAFKVLLRGTPEEKLWEKAYSKFSNNIDIVNELKQSFQKAGSPEAFADLLIRKNDSQSIRNLKFLLGDEEGRSEGWNAVKGAWIQGLLEKHTSNANGVLSAQSMFDEIDSYGKDVVRQIFTDAEFNKLRAATRLANKINISDLDKPGTRKSIDSLVEWLAVGPPGSVARLFFKFSRKSKDAQDYLLNEAFIKAARESSTSKKLFLMDVREEFAQLVKSQGKIIHNPKMGMGETFERFINPITSVPPARAFDEKYFGNSSQIDKEEE